MGRWGWVKRDAEYVGLRYPCEGRRTFASGLAIPQLWKVSTFENELPGRAAGVCC